MAGDLGDQLVQLVGDLLALEPGQALQAQIEDGARLLVGQPVGAVGGDAAARLVDQRDQRRRYRRPASAAPSARRARSPDRARRGSAR